jgi:hypothetical protein
MPTRRCDAARNFEYGDSSKHSICRISQNSFAIWRQDLDEYDAFSQHQLSAGSQSIASAELNAQVGAATIALVSASTLLLVTIIRIKYSH